MMDESDLITGIRNGNVQCFEKLFIKYYSHFNQFIFGFVKNEWISEDITQNTFIKVWINREKLQSDLSIHSYLYVIAKYEIYNYFRSKQNQVVERFLDGVHDIAVTPNTENELLLDEMQDTITTTIEAMPEKRRIIFKMSRFEHKSAKEIAEIMNISARTVEKHIELALRELRTKLTPFLFWILAYGHVMLYNM
ncbi:RNA polymerase sigma-70 factor [Bacteroides sp.]